MKRLTKTLLVMALAATAATTTGCFRRVQIENVAGVQTPSLSVPANGATSMKAEIDMGAGELTVSGSALGSDALRGDFTFAPSNLKPEVIDSRNGDVLFATVRQPDASKVPPLSLTGPLDIVNKWDIELSDALPTELVLNMGAGESTVDLSDVDVTELTVNLGAGDAKVDLSGERERDVRGLVQAGAGAIEIRLPKDLPVRVAGRQDGVGNWDYSGFITDGNAVVNDAWREARGGVPAPGGSIELDVQRGVGDVRLVLVD